MRTIEIDRGLLKSLLVLTSVVEARDPFTAGHLWRTSRYARVLGEKLGLDSGDLFLAQLGGLVHDIGKIGLPDSILNKRGRLGPEEYETVKLHPQIGLTIIANHPLAPLVREAVSMHHLRHDGKGYPAWFPESGPGVIGSLTSIVDAFDAITSCRPYHGQAEIGRAIEVLETEKGRQFHPDYTGSFAELARTGALDHILGHYSENGLLLSCRECGPILAPPRGVGDGDKIDCPSCRGEFVLHASRGTFDLEWVAAAPTPYVPRPDLDTVEELVREAPPKANAEP